MMSNNKILTVSYGTFSCTLEGFDDSFDTMKAIAEYFRDLAADDRYFGAEPPQPDAEMLARIAEREIARRVEAHLSEDGVHLRASEATVDSQEAPEPAQAPASSASAAARTAEPDTGTHDAADSHPPAPHSEATVPPQTETATPQQFSPLQLPSSQSFTIVSMSATLPAASEVAQPEIAGHTVPDVATGPNLADAENEAARFFARHAEESTAAFPLAEEVPARMTKPAPNSIADKLQRIRAVVSKTHEPQAVYSEDEHAEAILDEDEAGPGLVSDFFSATTDAADHDVAAGEDADTELADTLARLSDEFDTAGVAEVPDQPDDAEAVEAGNEDRDDDPDSDYDFSSLFAEGDAGAVDAEAVVDVATTPAVRARVIRVKREDLEAAMDAGLLEAADADETGSTDQGPADATAARTPEEVAAEEIELDRLMSEADNQLDESDSSSRRAVFDQMRGAVAAARSDDGLDSEDSADEQAYRTDLAAVVTPRRPVAGGRTDRPRDQRPAPLKLVAEQRIDIPSARTGPVKPRRVAAPLAAPGKSDANFADYAAARGAQDLPEMLEAAAAYLTFIEGRDQFSRPQLMSMVRQIDTDGFCREDGLRQFGMLLRSGKIEKVDGGRFKVSDDIGFRPDGERAAG